MRVGIVALIHESNTFISRPTTWEHFQEHALWTGDDIRRHLAEAPHEVGGFFAGLDAAGLTDVVAIVVRYFGGTLLGTSGLIQAYRESTAEALRQAQVVEKIVSDHFRIRVDYALLPDLMNALKKQGLELGQQDFNDTGALLAIGIRQSEVPEKLLHLKALLWKVSTDEAQTLEWPAGVLVSQDETPI